MKTIILLTFSNIFMTIAWYGHLKFKEQHLWKVILVSWLIALLEYCLQVPANRIGSNYFSLFQLKTLQEAISLTVFILFAVFMMNEQFKWNYLVAFIFILLAVVFIFKK
ncbi:MAG: DMT family protein [Bacteroidia bacterium]|nr:DMT family protein [Bacteroidia bacterium]MCZ2248327.1 DMT family protein [Bacteroidia bacterium]